MLVINQGPIIINTEMQNVKNEKWFSTDDITNYKNNINKDIWKNEDITYNFNSLGYRTIELENIDNTDFVLTFGCSYTEGVGLHTHQIWNHYIKEYTNYQLFNAAKEATGIDVQTYNSMCWIQSLLPMPKLVVIQWPHKSRKSFATKTEEGVALIDNCENLSTRDGVWWTKRYIVDESEMNLNVLMQFELANYAWAKHNVPVLNFSWDEDLEPVLINSKFKLHYMPYGNSDRARDGIHDGPISHLKTANHIIELLKLGNFTYKI
tara:strand:+ start:469 stop:1260 length:792 start_codon:yes stop_codon:yes gene_type:complete